MSHQPRWWRSHCIDSEGRDGGQRARGHVSAPCRCADAAAAAAAASVKSTEGAAAAAAAAAAGVPKAGAGTRPVAAKQLVQLRLVHLWTEGQQVVSFADAQQLSAASVYVKLHASAAAESAARPSRSLGNGLGRLDLPTHTTKMHLPPLLGWAPGWSGAG